MQDVYWSPADRSAGAIAAGFTEAVGFAGFCGNGETEVKRLVLPGLSHAYSAASQGRGGFYNASYTPIRVPRRTHFIGEEVHTGYDPVCGMGSSRWIDPNDATEMAEFRAEVRAAGAEWWAAVAALPPAQRTPERCLKCAMRAARKRGVVGPVVRGLVETIGASELIAAGVFVGATTPGEIEDAREQFVADGGDEGYFDTAVRLMEQTGASAKELIEDAGHGVLTMQQQALDALKYIAREKEVTTREGAEGWEETKRQWGKSGQEAIKDVAEVPKEGSENLMWAVVAVSAALFGIGYYMTTTGTAKTAFRETTKQSREMGKVQRNIGRTARTGFREGGKALSSATPLLAAAI